ncbi:unnamed protein product [Echinostoma caproni]|uniref:Immediate early response 3 n=1 Tax=Echinostoma caproni TaxID=27848 RepID=A0A183BDU0_9TREM|nr:unnamed protein product [Echinostoma caproni]
MAGSPYVSCGKLCEPEVDPSTAQFVLFASMQKLDQARRSRGGIRLHQGLLIAVTALKARQLLWQQSNYFHNPLQLDPVKPIPSPQPSSTPESQSPLPVSSNITLGTQSDPVVLSCETVPPIANPVWPPLSTEDYFSFPKTHQDQEMTDDDTESAVDPNDDSDCPLDSVRNLCFASDPVIPSSNSKLCSVIKPNPCLSGHSYFLFIEHSQQKMFDILSLLFVLCS